DREVPPAEQPDRQHRRAASALVDQEDAEQDDSPEAAAPDLRAAPADDRLADQGDDRPGQAEEGEDRPEPVDARVDAAGLAGGHSERDEDERQHDERDVDREDQPPRDRVDQVAAGQWAN